MKKRLLLLLGLFVSPFLFSQILTVNSSASVSIASGSSISLDGLEIAPSDTYVISGVNNISRSSAAVTSGAIALCLECLALQPCSLGFLGRLSSLMVTGSLMVFLKVSLFLNCKQMMVVGLPMRVV